MPILCFISSFEGTIRLIKNYKIQLPVFFLLFLHHLLQQQISFFNKFSWFHSTLSQKYFYGIFSFVDILTKLPDPLNNQNPLSVREVFCQCFLRKLWVFYWTLIWKPKQGRVRVLLNVAQNFYTSTCSKNNTFMRNVNINYLYMLPLT